MDGHAQDSPPLSFGELSPAEQWTLHHVLLDRIEQEARLEAHKERLDELEATLDEKEVPESRSRDHR